MVAVNIASRSEVVSVTKLLSSLLRFVVNSKHITMGSMLFTSSVLADAETLGQVVSSELLKCMSDS